uniref:RAB3A interacting protein (rabin3)-like 1 n=1 Tax=Oryzias melastigma TaxID=30732 RepID=A0A3B3CEJ7_ORYME
MDAFEGLHRVHVSPSPPPSSSSSLGYEVLKSGRSGIAVYSSSIFFGTPNFPAVKHKSGRFTQDELVDLDPEPELRLEGGGHGGPTSGRSHGDLTRLRSSSLEIREKEIREKGSEILREQLDAAKKELKLKDKECERLSQVRNQLEQELEELTASLFEEAHKMVREANVKQAGAEKQLKEAQGKMDSILYTEFLLWRERPSLDRSSAFLSRIYREDIGPCLSFTRSELSQLVQGAVESNSLTIEPVAIPMIKSSSIECGGPKKCALSGLSRPCQHRIKLGDKGTYYYISPSSRARITTVCNFFTYIRYIQQGLVRHDAEQMFWEVMRLRREMAVAKLGFYLTDQG